MGGAHLRGCSFGRVGQLVLLLDDVQVLWTALLLDLKECSSSFDKSDIDMICSSKKEKKFETKEKDEKQKKIEFAVR